MSPVMGVSVLSLIVFFAATFLAAVVTGISGFAFGLIAAGIWLHVITPLQTATLIVAFGLLAQGSSVWKLRHALDWTRLWPFILGGAAGVPVGIAILTWANPKYLREGVGVLLVLYSVYSLARPNLKPIRTNAVFDAAIGFGSGVVGGVTGLAGIVVAIWCNLLALPKDEQRTIFQPVAIAIFLFSAVWLGGKGTVTQDTVFLFFAGLPVLFLGLWLGLKLYGRLNDQSFRKLILALLFLSGASLFI